MPIPSYLQSFTVLSAHPGHIPRLGKSAGIELNRYWRVSDNECEFYIMETRTSDNQFNYSKFSIESLDKFLKFKEIEFPTWYVGKNGYVTTHYQNSGIYLHQHLLDYYGQQTNPDLHRGLSVDHINQDKLDNRLTNLRLATQHEQNTNTSRVYDKGTNLPAGCLFNSADIPKYITYYPERTNNGAKHGEHFVVEFRLQATKQLIKKKTTKSVAKSLYYKFIQAIKLRYQLFMAHPQIHDFSDSDELLREHQELITRIARLDAIPVGSAEFLDMNHLDFPDRVDISHRVAEIQQQAEDQRVALQKQARAEREFARGNCPDCGNEIVIKTLPRHKKLYCSARVLTEEEKTAIAEKKKQHYEKVSKTKIATGARKLTDEDILVIQESVRQGITQQVLSTKYGVSRQYIADVVNGKIKLRALVE